MPSAVPPSNDADATESAPKSAITTEQASSPGSHLASAAEGDTQAPERARPEGDSKRKAQTNAVSLVLAVFWSFFGVRRSRDMEADAASLNPLHLAAAAVIGMLSFVAILLLVVHMVLQ